MAGENNGGAFEWLSGGLFFGSSSNSSDSSSRNSQGCIASIDSEKDVNSLLKGIQENLNGAIISSSVNHNSADKISSTNVAANNRGLSSSPPSQSVTLAARLARLRFLLYDERRVTSQQESPNRRGKPSVAIRTVESLEGAGTKSDLRDLIPILIRNLQLLPFESRKHVTAIFNYLLVCGFDGIDRDLYIPIMEKFRDYVALNFDAIISPIVNVHVSSFASSAGDSIEVNNNNRATTTTDVILHCGSMYRSCFRHAKLYGQLVVTTTRVERFVIPFIDRALLPNFDVSSDAMENLKLVMTAGATCNDNNDSTAYIDTSSQQELAELAASFLTRDYEAVFDQRFNPKLLSGEANYMTKRIALQILSTVLLTRSNYNTMIRYVNSRSNLILVMKLLRDNSPHITLDAFHVFKVMVANPNKIPQVEKILKDNSQKLCTYLETLHYDKEASDQQFADEKRLIITTIRGL